jgi:hypothetical protein
MVDAEARKDEIVPLVRPARGPTSSSRSRARRSRKSCALPCPRRSRPPDDEKGTPKRAPPAPTGEAAYLRQEHLVDDVDDAVRLDDIGDRDVGHAARLVAQHDRRAALGGGERAARNLGQRRLAATASIALISAALSILPTTTW